MCEVITMPDGSRAIVCRGHSRGGRKQRCATCKAPATLLCDGPTPIPGRTCDKPICAAHAKKTGPDRHLCNGCAERARMVGREP